MRLEKAYEEEAEEWAACVERHRKRSLFFLVLEHRMGKQRMTENKMGKYKIEYEMAERQLKKVKDEGRRLMEIFMRERRSSRQLIPWF